MTDLDPIIDKKTGEKMSDAYKKLQLPQHWREKLAKTQEKALKREEKLKMRVEQLKQQKRLKKKEKSLKKLKDELQRITNRIVRIGDEPRTNFKTCFTCDKELLFADRQAGHHFSRGASSSARFSFDNLRNQCVTCNLHLSGNQVEFAYRLRKELGDEEYENLYRLAHTVKKWSREELEALIEERKLLLTKLENGKTH